jgi:dolichyl-phosphate beta-glucosyltransferase
MGRVLNWIIQLTAVRGIQDTQCGFKMFSRRAAEDLFEVQQMVGIGFDVELIFVAKKRGYKIKEVPITWYFDADSRMRLIFDSLHILLEIFEIHKNWQRGVYARQESTETEPDV